MKHKCTYFLQDDEGVLRCVQCGKPAHSEEQIEDKAQKQHETKENGKRG